MVEVNNLTSTKIDDGLFQELAKVVLQGEERKTRMDLSVALVGQGRMREINKAYRGKNKATDVLSFEGRKPGSKRFVMPPELAPGLGEIVICLKEVRKTARKTGSKFEKELSRVFIHGLLHLLGYDHEKSQKEADKMKAKEQFYSPQTGD